VDFPQSLSQIADSPAAERASASPLFPAFLILRGREVVLVGGGNVALGKLAALVEAGARVTVIAPEIRPELAREGVRLVRRVFDPRDLDGAWLAIAAAPAPVNRQVAAAAEERRIFVNAVDDLAAASAYLGGVVRKGGVTLAISTDGRAPALAGLLREAFEALLPDEIGDWIATAHAVRARWRAARVPMPERRPLLLRALVDLYAKRGAA
jgi:uroporphyrin-III C-methyltransferase/precorrin-2 dehydrogenase/sirohydrochlorin ferrochelatase